MNIACEDKNLPMLQYFRNNDCDMNLQSTYSWYPLMKAGENSFDCFEYLINEGADIHLKSSVCILIIN